MTMTDPYALPARDSLTDVPGLRVGHWTNLEAGTGCTVVLCPPDGATAACAVLGGAPGTRETDVLTPGNSVEKIHAVLLTGGSAFGLDAAGGVMQVLEAAGVGYPVRNARVPIVTGAVIFDLAVGRVDIRPTASDGAAAADAAESPAYLCGNVGAGAGASVAKLAGIPNAIKGGLGVASEPREDGSIVGALAVVNAVGEVVRPEDGRVVAGVRAEGGGWRDVFALLRTERREPPVKMENTTIAVVATDIALHRDALQRIALMAHAGLARTLRPSHTPADGDTVIAISTGSRQVERPDILAIGALAARALERAILRAVLGAEPLHGIPSARAWCAAPEHWPIASVSKSGTGTNPT